jgi:transposase
MLNHGFPQKAFIIMSVVRHHSEKEPEVKRKLSFPSVVAAGMEVKEAIAHFGISVATGYDWVRRWN